MTFTKFYLSQIYYHMLSALADSQREVALVTLAPVLYTVGRILPLLVSITRMVDGCGIASLDAVRAGMLSRLWKNGRA